MQCFKEGGHTKVKAMCYGGKAMKKGGEVDAADIAQDKKIIKKAFSMHDKQEHGGEKTDLSKLRKGGRAKKEAGTVKKFKTGGSIGLYGAKKTSADLKNIEEAKTIKPKKLADGGTMILQKPGKPAGTVTADKKGGKIKKMADGGATGVMANLATLEEKRRLEKLKRAGQLGPAQQTELLNQPGGQAAAGVAPATPANSATPPQEQFPMQPSEIMAQQQGGYFGGNRYVNPKTGNLPPPLPGAPALGQKRGGKVKGKC